MSVLTDQIPLYNVPRRSASTHLKVCRNKSSRHPLIRQLAWLVKQQGLIYVFHKLLLVNAKVSQMSLVALGLGLAGLAATTAGEDQNNYSNTQSHQNKIAFYNLLHFSFPLSLYEVSTRMSTLILLFAVHVTLILLPPLFFDALAPQPFTLPPLVLLFVNTQRILISSKNL
jgi:hypothetical protein